MKKAFICLANSYKYKERCIAGIEIETGTDGKFSVVLKDGTPKWIRPVSGCEHGQVPAALVENIKLLDIIEFEMTEECPLGYQSENVRFNESSLKKIGEVPAKEEMLDLLVDRKHGLLFGNKGKAVHQDMIVTVDHSLVFIGANSFKVVTDKKKSDKFRAVFEYNDVEYDLPITDVDFLREYSPDRTKDLSRAYLCISLGVLYGEFYYKLCAGLIFAEQ